MTSMKSVSNTLSQKENTKLEENKQSSSSSTSTDSTHDSNPKNLKYIFVNNNKSYELNMILYEEKIKIKIYPLSEGKEKYFYQKEFTQENLGQINKVFHLCTDIEDSFVYFDRLFSDKQNKLTVNEVNDVIKLEKKIKLSPTLKIEIPKIIVQEEKNTLNKEINNKKEINPIDNLCDIENISPLNIANEKLLTENKKNKIHNFLYNNIKEESDIIELPEEQEDENEILENEMSKKNNLLNTSRIKSNNINNISTEEKKQQNNNNSLLNKKRTTTNSDLLSDISFNSFSNENEGVNMPQKKPKNNLAKEDFLKIFSDNNSINSGESSEKFFTKIQKNLNLEKIKNKEKDNIINNLIEIPNKKNFEFNPEIKKEEKNENGEGNYLFSDTDSCDEINDDIEFFSNKSNKSPTITPIGGKINNFNDFKENKFELFNKEQHYNNGKYENNNSINNNNFYLDKNYNNCISSIQNIKIGEGNNINNIPSWKMNNLYNMSNNSKLKKNYKNNSDNSYKIIHKNFIENFDNDNYGLFNEHKNILNNSFSIESDIIKGYPDIDFIIKYLKNKFNKKLVDGIRIYQASINGAKAEDFHSSCDGTTNIIIIIKTKDGKKFGGYTSKGFNSFNRSCYDDTAFLFSIDKREIYPNIKGKYAIESYYNLGPCFSGDSIKIFDNFFERGGITTKNCGNFEMNEDYQINSGKKAFEIEEIEVIEFIEMKDDDDNNNS